MCKDFMRNKNEKKKDFVMFIELSSLVSCLKYVEKVFLSFYSNKKMELSYLKSHKNIVKTMSYHITLKN